MVIRIRTSETKKKISDSCKKSEKVKNTKIKRSKNNVNEFICNNCGEKGIDRRYNTNRKYHNECWKLISGGIRDGSSRGKYGWYKGYRCDSSYELAYLIFNIEHNNKIERNKDGFEYFFNDKKHLFYPDFIVNGEYVEVKNYRSELTDCKLKYFPTKIDIYYKDTMKPYLEYVIDKYGKDFINLYEKNENI